MMNGRYLGLFFLRVFTFVHRKTANEIYFDFFGLASIIIGRTHRHFGDHFNTKIKSVSHHHHPVEHFNNFNRNLMGF